MDCSSQNRAYDRSLIVGYDPFPPDRRVVDPETARVFIDGGILNVLTITGFSSRVSRHLQGTGRRIGGGIVLFLIALKMIFPSGSGSGLMGDYPDGEPLLVPLAVPLLAGPSTLAMLILLTSSAPERWLSWLLALVLAWLVTSGAMLCADNLHRLLGKKGLIAIERLMGMVLVTLAVQMLLDGISEYLIQTLQT